MKILFVQPGLEEIDNQYPPVGICYLAAETRNHGYSVDVYDASAIGCSLIKALGVVKDFQPNVLCLSLYTIGLIEQYRFLKEIKAALPTCIAIVGGPHATSLPLYTMQECPDIDYLVFGEGERTLVELLDVIRAEDDATHINGICYRKNGEVIQNAPRDMIGDLDELSFPAYDLIAKNGFHYKRRSFNLTQHIGVILSSRGCPFHCAFCFKATFGNRLRRRSPENVVAEMRWQIDQFGVTEFQFLDDLFAVNSKWLDEFSAELDRQNVKIPWKCLARVNSVKRNDLVTMHRHGCYGVEFGVESGNDGILALAHKGITTSQVRAAFRDAKDIGLLTFGFFIFGLEHDTHETIKQTCSFAIEISPDLCGFAVLLPFPGTRIYDQLPQSLRFEWHMFNSYYDKNALPFSLCEVAPRDLRKYAQQADAEVAGSFSYLSKNVVFKKGGYRTHRKEAFNNWFRSIKILFARRIKGQRVFGNNHFILNLLVILRDVILLSIISIFLVWPNKFLRRLQNSH